MLSVRWKGRVQHSLLEKNKEGLFSLDPRVGGKSTIKEMVKFHMDNKVCQEEEGARDRSPSAPMTSFSVEPCRVRAGSSPMVKSSWGRCSARAPSEASTRECSPIRARRPSP